MAFIEWPWALGAANVLHDIVAALSGRQELESELVAVANQALDRVGADARLHVPLQRVVEDTDLDPAVWRDGQIHSARLVAQDGGHGL